MNKKQTKDLSPKRTTTAHCATSQSLRSSLSLVLGGCVSFAFTVFVNAAEPLKVPQLEDCPLVSRVWVGSERVRIGYPKSTILVATKPGPILLNITDNGWVEKGTHWATVDPEMLRIDERSLAIEKKKMAQQLEEVDDFFDEKDFKTRKSLDELAEKKAELLYLLKSDEVPAQASDRIKAALIELEKKEEGLLQKNGFEKRVQHKELRQEELKVSLLKKEKTHETMRQAAELIIPFSGFYELLIPLPEGVVAGNGCLVKAEMSERLVRLEDNRRVEFRVSPISEDVYGVKRQNLLIEVSNGRSVIGSTYSRADKIGEGIGQKEEWVFLVNDQFLEQAKARVGQSRLAKVYTKLPKPARLVMKNQIALLNPEVLALGSWRGLVKHLWPEAQVVFIGPTSIAIDLPNSQSHAD